MKTLLLLCALIIFSSLGEILSARGMKQIGEISFWPRLLWRTLPRLVRNPNLILGICCLAFSFFSFLSLLSYADLSFVVPLTAVSYLTNTIGSRLLLKEKISAARWWGTVLVTLGVSIISLPSRFDSVLLSINQWGWQQLGVWLWPEEYAPMPVLMGLLGLRVLLLILVIAAIVYYLIAIIAGWCWAQDRQRQRALGRGFQPPVSILIPVRGAGPEAYEIFAGFCRQDYPSYQVIFGCRDEHDPVIPIIRRVQTDFPEQQIDLVISAQEIGYNAKVCNLNNMYAQARYDFLVAVDSDIRVTPDYLWRVMAPLERPEVGIVTCLYRGARAQTFASLLENIGISSNFGPEVMTSRALEGIKFALGSTIATRREILQKIGGFPAVADYLADDFLWGNYTAAAGYQIILSDYIVDHVSSAETLTSLLKHQLRWGRAIRISRPKGYAGLILTYGLASSLMLLLSLGFSSIGWAIVGLTFFVRLVAALYGGVVLMKDFALLKYFWLIPVRDLLGFLMWAMSLGGREIEWRGDRFIVLRDGKIRPVPEN